MNWRLYDKDRDHAAVHRVLVEVGWSDGQAADMATQDALIDCGRAVVAEVDGTVEAGVCTSPGTYRYLHDDLPFCCVTGVTVSRIARKLRLARRLVAESLALSAAEGALVAGLTMFEQGFYNHLGFGSGCYRRRVMLDPARLRVHDAARVPCRLTADDWAEMHAGRLARRRGHGACNLTPPGVTRCGVLEQKGGFGLGYRDAQGALTHHFWCVNRGGENGPYGLEWLAWQQPAQLLELLALLRSLGDQVQSIDVPEPAGVQLMDLVDRPLRGGSISAGGKHATGLRASVAYQFRLLDLPGCLAHTHLPVAPLRFNLQLDDPVAALLDDSAPWRGCGGEYVVTLGPESAAVPGRDERLPTLTAGLGAFTRLWLGVRPATGLAITDDLHGPDDLLDALDERLRLPEPVADWAF